MSQFRRLLMAQKQGSEPSYIVFADPEVARVLAAAGIGDGVGITIEEARAVTSIPSFNKNSIIESFNELKYFSNITSLGGNYFNGTFQNCTNLRSIAFPESLRFLDSSALGSCALLKNVDFSRCKNTLEYIGQNTLASSPIEGVLELPALQFVYAWGAYATQFSKIILEGIKVLENGQYPVLGAFSCNPILKEVILGAEITKIGTLAFFRCTNLDTFICKAVTPPSISVEQYFFSLGECPLNDGIYVPDSSVDAYKSADGWSYYASIIKPISQYNG